ncbi:MAG: helix-turn-helix domain-containing protein [Clostridia bacterium]|nr:helix-turn-helix domain-containing protein [Clostridia bacterium]
MSYFSVNFKRLRKQKGLTQAQVAAYLGVTKSTISNYESGYVEHLDSHEKLARIAELFGVTINELLNEPKITVTTPDPEKPELVEIPSFPLDQNGERAKIALTRDVLGKGEFLGFRIIDESLKIGRLEQGDMVICLRTENVPEDELALVLIEKRTHLLRYVKVDADNIFLFTEKSGEPTVYPKDKVDILGKAVKKFCNFN